MRTHDTEIYLKSGHVLKFHSSDVTISRNGFGDITQLEWKKEGGRELISLGSVLDIAAVISIDYRKRRLLKIKNLLSRKRKSGKK